MYEILNSFKQKPIPKFQQTLINFEKPQNFQNPQNLGFKTWNACKWRKLEAYQVKENLKKLEESLGRGLEWEKEVWEVKRQSYRERDREKWGLDHIRIIYRTSINLNKRRCRSRCRAKCWGFGCRQIQVSRKCRGTKHQTQEMRLDQSTRCWEAIKGIGTFSIDPPGVKEVSRLQ